MSESLSAVEGKVGVLTLSNLTLALVAGTCSPRSQSCRATRGTGRNVADVLKM